MVLDLDAINTMVAITTPPQASTDTTSSDVATQNSVPELASLVEVGGTVEIAGGDFMADSVIRLTLHSTPRDAGSVTTDSVGSFVASVVVPNDFESGVHHIEAAGLDPSGQPASVRVGFYVKRPDIFPRIEQTSSGAGRMLGTVASSPAVVSGGALVALALMSVAARSLVRSRRERRAAAARSITEPAATVVAPDSVAPQPGFRFNDAQRR
jgi:hypothetical protein